MVVRQRKTQGGEKWWLTKGPSIFVDNLPEFYDRHLLRKLFNGCGKVVDCHIPWRKRINSNTRYGFVFFLHEDDGLLAARRLNGVKLFGHVITVTKSFINGESISKQGKENQQVYKSSCMMSYAEVLAQKQKGKWIEKRKGEGSMNKLDDFPELKKTVHDNEKMKLILKSEWEELLNNHLQQKMKIEKLEILCQTIQDEIVKMKEEKNERNRNKEEEEDLISEEEEYEGSNAFDKDEEERVKVSETVLEGDKGGLMNEEEVNMEEERLSPVNVEGNDDMAAGKKTEGRADVLVSGSFMEREQNHDVENSEEVANLKTKEKIHKNHKKYKHNFLSLNQQSLRHKFEGISVKGKCMKKRKNKSGLCLGDSFINEELESFSGTVSKEPEIGDEFYNRLRREKIDGAKIEADRTVEIGRMVGVVFKPNPSSAIEKLLEMEK